MAILYGGITTETDGFKVLRLVAVCHNGASSLLDS